MFTYEICDLELSEKAAEDLFNADSTAQWSVDAVKTRHETCIIKRDQSEKISTSFLATCHQIYNEARHIPYTTNTFSFRNESTLDEFINYLMKSESGHHLDIRRIHHDIKVRDSVDEQRWKLAITRYLIPRLPEVHQISISLVRWYRAGVIGPRTPAEFEAHSPSWDRDHLISALLELRQLPLKRATFTISDIAFDQEQRLPDAERRQHRWTLAEKRAWARFVKNYILGKDNGLTSSSSLVVQEQGKRDVNAELGKARLLEE